jgi:hypothetical protein
MNSDRGDELSIANAVYIVLASKLKKKKKLKTRNWWNTTLFKNRERFWKLVIGI